MLARIERGFWTRRQVVMDTQTGRVVRTALEREVQALLFEADAIVSPAFQTGYECPLDTIQIAAYARGGHPTPSVRTGGYETNRFATHRDRAAESTSSRPSHRRLGYR